MEKLTLQIPKKKGSGRKLLYPFDSLNVGECLVLSKSEEKNRISIVNAAYQYAGRNGKQITVRKDNGKTHIFRTK